MAKHIGIVACSAEGAALCYRTVCGEAPALMGAHCHPEITMHTHPLSEYMKHIRPGNWRGVADLMIDSARKVAQVGAELAVCPDNTIHEAFDRVEKESPIPWLHIAREVVRQAKEEGRTCLGILGTKYLMEGPVYADAAAAQGVACLIPDEDERIEINRIIFDELVYGVLKEKARLYFVDVMQNLKRQGADAVVLGCTEIPLIVGPDNCPLATLDSTRLLARAALREALR